MDIDKILSSGIINLAELSRRMWPENKSARSRLMHKIANRNGQRLTERDRENIKQIIKEITK